MPIAKRVYRLLERRQKQAFVLILCIMAVSAGLTQFPPKAIGFLTDDILRQDGHGNDIGASDDEQVVGFIVGRAAPETVIVRQQVTVFDPRIGR